MRDVGPKRPFEQGQHFAAVTAAEDRRAKRYKRAGPKLYNKKRFVAWGLAFGALPTLAEKYGLKVAQLSGGTLETGGGGKE